MRTIEERLSAAGVPRRHLQCSFANFLPRAGTEQALAIAEAWAHGTARGRGLVLLGPPGAGKTHLMVASMRVRMEPHDAERPGGETTAQAGSEPVRLTPFWRVAFRVVPVMLDDLRASIRLQTTDAEEDLSALRDDMDLVVLDDLGAERSTDWAVSRLFALVEKRYGDMRATCVTSNLSLDQLADNGYRPLVSRVTEMCDIVTISASDMRPEKGRATATDRTATVVTHSSLGR
ncbi:MAG: hypothetical protein ACLQBX_13680 [Candidatus Limnocylindrales bacterium]